MTTPTLHPLDLTDALAGQYAVEREIGRGGMGVVYLARDLKLDRQVGIKTLPAHLASDPAVRERFLREAKTAGSLSHPNIVPIHRADELAGQVFFVMGYVDGDSLAARVRARGHLTAGEVVGHLKDVAAALAYAHDRHVIHRDVKAENILIDRETGRAVVTDFGIARLAESAPLTATGQLLGTVYYLSPEQISGDPVDLRSDVYSLGVVGYFALSGRFPFDAPLASAVLIAHVNKRLPPLASVAPDVDPALASVIERCLAKDPNDRFASCRELLDSLASVATGLDRTVTSPGRPQGPLVSDTEAHAILQRAAELDALTAARARPRIAPSERDAQRDLERTSGFRLGNVRDAAIEVGIGEQHVDRALAEHGLLSRPTTPGRSGETGATRPRGMAGWPSDHRPPLVVQEQANRADALVHGAKVNLRYFVEVDGEMPERDFDVLVSTLRQEAGNIGQLSAVGRSFMWESDPGATRDLRASILARDGRTTISVYESLESVVPTALSMKPATALAAASLLALVGLARDPDLLLFAVPGGIVAYAALYLHDRANRARFVSQSLERQAAVRALATRLSEHVQDSIAASSPTPDGPDGPSGGGATAVSDMRRPGPNAGITAAVKVPAVVERGSTPSGSTGRPDIVVRSGKPTPAARLVGRPLQLECEVTLNGEMRSADFDLMVDLLRGRLRDRGRIEPRPNSLAWSAMPGMPRQVDVLVVPRYGKTTIRLTESLTQLASNLFGWIGLGGTAAGFLVFLRLSDISLFGGLQIWGGMAVLSYMGPRGLFGRFSNRRRRALKDLAEEVVIQAQNSIAASGSPPAESQRPRTYVLDGAPSWPRDTA